jgi:hypothetical protein
MRVPISPFTQTLCLVKNRLYANANTDRAAPPPPLPQELWELIYFFVASPRPYEIHPVVRHFMTPTMLNVISHRSNRHQAIVAMHRHRPPSFIVLPPEILVRLDDSDLIFLTTNVVSELRAMDASHPIFHSTRNGWYLMRELNKRYTLNQRFNLWKPVCRDHCDYHLPY